MLEDGRTNAVAVVLQHLLCALERKGVMTKAVITTMLDEVVDEVVDLTTRGTFSAEASAEARRTVGLLYLPKNR